MPATKTFVNYKSALTSFEVANERFNGLFEPGRIRGFDEIFLPTPGLTFGISHELTGIEKTRLDGTSISAKTGVIFTKQGVIAQFEETVTGLAANSNAGGGAERIDVIYFQHTYQQSVSPNLGLILIQEGTPGAGEPALPVPAQMVKLGILRIPDGATQLTTSMWEPAEVAGVGGKETQTKTQIISTSDNLNDKRTQELYGFYESAKNALPTFNILSGVNPTQSRGLILGDLQMDDNDPALTVIQPFFYYADGKVCKFNGGTFNLTDAALLIYPSNTILPGNPDLPWDVIHESSTYLANMNTTSIDGTGGYPAGVEAVLLASPVYIDTLDYQWDSWRGVNHLSTIAGTNFVYGGKGNNIPNPLTATGTLNESIDERIKALAIQNITKGSTILTVLAGFTETRNLKIYRNSRGSIMSDGSVSIQGQAGVMSTLIATLPVGYRPAQDQYFRAQVSWDNNGYSQNALKDFQTWVSVLQVYTNGEIKIANLAGLEWPGNPGLYMTWGITLQGCSWVTND